MWAWLLESIFTGVGLSMDAMAVSAVLGATAAAAQLSKQSQDDTSATAVTSIQPPPPLWLQVLLPGAFFGFFQAAMPLIGWLAGSACGGFILALGRYLAAALVGGVGIKMILDRESQEKVDFKWRVLLLLAFATSIDALVIGVSYACLGRTAIWGSIAIIGGVTAILSSLTVLVGRYAGVRLGRKCSIAGGVILLVIGLRMLISG